MTKKKIRVLVVDDHLVWRKTLKMSFAILPDVGAVDALPNDLRVIPFCKNTQPDLILMDINLFDAPDGFALAREVIHSVPNAKIIGVTADVLPDALELAQTAGLQALISKDRLLDHLSRKQLHHLSQSEKSLT